METATTILKSFYPKPPWEDPITIPPGQTPVKFVISNPLYWFSHKVFISDTAFASFYSWLPRTKSQTQGKNYPLFYSNTYWYHQPYPSANPLEFKTRETYMKVFKYKLDSGIFSSSTKLYCKVLRSQKRKYFFYELMFNHNSVAEKVCMFQHIDWPIIDFRIGHKQYRWLYYYMPLNPMSSYVYSLYEAQEGESTLAEFINPDSGVIWKNNIFDSTKDGPAFQHPHDRFKLSNKIGELKGTCMPWYLVPFGYRKTGKFHTFEQETSLTDSIESISELNQIFVCTALLLKLHEEYRWIVDNDEHMYTHRKFRTRIGYNKIRP